ncbi:hypothetical protein FN846DRAFT_466285 [Sphaerosporella brunnea]|uniref:t-SNARE coiled-coil homology domain-containing protein n=1 Tax=Sphaerosporella brunnea TaxID=1250544 RepID=A0A5J5F416_9PEZI|nr:hypothetical protein FN846DRAFT_466285 [Sphaerosporella brunnea]
MSEAYERERQNNALLDDLASKVTALRGVTVDIYDQARDHQVIDHSNEVLSSFNTSLKNSVGRIRLMAQTGGKTQTLRLAAMIVGGVVVLYLLWGWLFG